MCSKIYNHILYNFVFPNEDSLNILIEKEKEKNNKYGLKCSDNINCIIITTIFLGIISICPIILSVSFYSLYYTLLTILPIIFLDIIFLDCYFGFLSKKYYKIQKISSNKIVKLYSIIDLYNNLNFSPIEELKITNNQIELTVNCKKYKYEINNEIISNNDDNVTINFNIDDINKNIICEVYYGTDNFGG